MLADPETAYLLPLAVIAHIDLNAFFAQCEQIRLGKTISDPVVCCQWTSLIAISYAARTYGIGRMDTLKSAQEKCPNLIVGHAAVFKKGESHWQYLNKLPDQAIHKVSLDPYRRELRKIIKILKSECDLVEKASVDECFLDFGRLIYLEMLEKFPELRDLKPNDDLPMLPEELPESLHWVGKVMPTLKEEQEKIERSAESARFGDNEDSENPGNAGNGNSNDPDTLDNLPLQDWDDVATLIGSQIMYKVRARVFKELKYTTSGGIGSTKPVAKLAGGFIKPDMQTIVRPQLTLHFLQNFELTDFTLMGGKTGEIALQRLGVPPDVNLIAYIRENWELDSMKKEFPQEEQVAEKIYELVRGTNRLKLKLRTDVKLMMSRKNFVSRHPVCTLTDAFDWIKVYSGDLYGRLIELDDENLNLSMLQKSGGERGFIYRPRTVSLHITTSSYSRHSKQTQFPVLQNLDKLKNSLEATGFRLLCEILDGTKANEMNPSVKFRELRPKDSNLLEYKIPVLANMSLVVTNFVKTSDANLIDLYGNTGDKQVSTQEVIKRLFDEVNKPKDVIVEEPKPKKVPRSNSYIRQLFHEFEEEKTNANVVDTNEHLEKGKSEEKGKFKEDKEYVKRMFEEFQTNKEVAKAASESPSNHKLKLPQTSILHNLDLPKHKELSPVAEDAFLKELIRNRFCSQCNVAVDDVFEHKDYHVALDLSLKLNGSGSMQVSPKKMERKEKPRKGKKLAKGQTQLPF